MEGTVQVRHGAKLMISAFLLLRVILASVGFMLQQLPNSQILA